MYRYQNQNLKIYITESISIDFKKFMKIIKFQTIYCDFDRFSAIIEIIQFKSIKCTYR